MKFHMHSLFLYHHIPISLARPCKELPAHELNTVKEHNSKLLHTPDKNMTKEQFTVNHRWIMDILALKEVVHHDKNIFLT
mgnify:CR=1 FL=1